MAQQRLLQHAASRSSNNKSSSRASLNHSDASREFSAESGRSAEIPMGASSEVLNDAPPTPNTTMDMFTDMEWAIPMPKVGSSSKRSMTDPEGARATLQHPSALPLPLFHADEKGPTFGFLKSKLSKATLSKNKEVSMGPAPPTTSEKALEVLGGKGKEPAAPHNRDASGSSVPDPYRLSVDSESSVIHHATPGPKPTKRWLLENKLEPRHQPSVASDMSVETAQCEYVTPKGKVEGMIIGDPSLSPTRQGTYGKSSQGAVIHSTPSIMSMAATVMNVSPKSFSCKIDRNSTEVLEPRTYSPVRQADRQHFSDDSSKAIYTPSVYNVQGGGAWETLQTKHPETLPEFIVSPAKPFRDTSSSTDDNNDEKFTRLIAEEALSKSKRCRIDPGLTIVTTPSGLEAMEKAKRTAKAWEKQATTSTPNHPKHTAAATGVNKDDSGQAASSQSAPPNGHIAYPVVPQVVLGYGHHAYTPSNPGDYSVSPMAAGSSPSNQGNHSAPSMAQGPLPLNQGNLIQPPMADGSVYPNPGNFFAPHQEPPQGSTHGQQGHITNNGGQMNDQAFQHSLYTTTTGGFSPIPQFAGYQSQGTLGEHVTQGFQTAHYHLDHETSRLHSRIQNVQDQTIDMLVRRFDQVFQANSRYHEQVQGQLAAMHNKMLQEGAAANKMRNEMSLNRGQHQELMLYLHREFGNVNNRLWAVNDRLTHVINRVDRVEKKLGGQKIAPADEPLVAPEAPPKPVSRKLTPMPRSGLAASETQASILARATTGTDNIPTTKDVTDDAGRQSRPRSNTAVRNSADEDYNPKTPHKASSPRKKAGGFFNKKPHQKSNSNDNTGVEGLIYHTTPYYKKNPHAESAHARGLDDPNSVHPAYREEYKQKQQNQQNSNPQRFASRDIRLEEAQQGYGTNDTTEERSAVIWPSIGGNHGGWSGGNWYHHEQVAGEKQEDTTGEK